MGSTVDDEVSVLVFAGEVGAEEHEYFLVFGCC